MRRKHTKQSAAALCRCSLLSALCFLLSLVISGPILTDIPDMSDMPDMPDILTESVWFQTAPACSDEMTASFSQKGESVPPKAP